MHCEQDETAQVPAQVCRITAPGTGFQESRALPWATASRMCDAGVRRTGELGGGPQTPG